MNDSDLGWGGTMWVYPIFCGITSPVNGKSKDGEGTERFLCEVVKTISCLGSTEMEEVWCNMSMREAYG